MDRRKYVLDDFDKFHDYGCLIPERKILFSSTYYIDGYGEAGVEFDSAQRTIKNLLFLDIRSDEPITIYWNSPGGEWPHGMAIYDVIKGCRSHVTMIGLGMVRSMGTIVMQACDERILTSNCDFMIHDGTEELGGTPKTVESWARYSKLTRDKMYKIYRDEIIKKHPKFTLAKVEEMCSHDCIMTPSFAVDLGLADKVVGEINCTGIV